MDAGTTQQAGAIMRYSEQHYPLLTKFRVGLDPLEREALNKKIEPTDGTRQAVMGMVLRQASGPDDSQLDQKLVRKWQQKRQLEQLPGQIDAWFAAEFMRWLRGVSVFNSRILTPWGNANLFHIPEVLQYLREACACRADFQRKLVLLAIFQPRTLHDAYIYYKYIVMHHGWSKEQYGPHLAGRDPDVPPQPYLTIDGTLDFLDDYALSTFHNQALEMQALNASEPLVFMPSTGQAYPEPNGVPSAAQPLDTSPPAVDPNAHAGANDGDDDDDDLDDDDPDGVRKKYQERLARRRQAIAAFAAQHPLPGLVTNLATPTPTTPPVVTTATDPVPPTPNTDDNLPVAATDLQAKATALRAALAAQAIQSHAQQQLALSNADAAQAAQAAQAAKNAQALAAAMAASAAAAAGNAPAPPPPASPDNAAQNDPVTIVSPDSGATWTGTPGTMARVRNGVPSSASSGAADAARHADTLIAMTTDYEMSHPREDTEARANEKAISVPENERGAAYANAIQEYDRTQTELYKALDEGRLEDAQKHFAENTKLGAVANELQRLMNPSPPTSTPSSPASAPGTPLGARQPSLGPDPFATADVDEELYQDIDRETNAAERSVNTLALSPDIYAEHTRSQSQKVHALSNALKRKVGILKEIRRQGKPAEAHEIEVFALEEELEIAKKTLDSYMTADQRAARKRHAARRLYSASQLGQATDPAKH